jgi:hypothetical protein
MPWCSSKLVIGRCDVLVEGSQLAPARISTYLRLCALQSLACGLNRMRVIDLDTGDTLQAANDTDLERAVKDFYEGRGEPKPDDEVSRLVSTRAYDASDS